MKSYCYLCGSSEDLTRDHVPPRCLFPDPLPSDLITVPCCRKCNSSFSKDDEAVRVWLTAPEELSEAGKWVQKNKVIERTLARGGKLVEHVRRSIRETVVGGVKRDVLDFPAERANRFFSRITAGLLAHYYPEFDRAGQIFEVLPLTFYSGDWNGVQTLMDAAEYDHRGTGVFEFRRKVNLEAKEGYWFYRFYEHALFSVWHSKTKKG